VCRCALVRSGLLPVHVVGTVARPVWGECAFSDPPPSEIYTLSLHDALPISPGDRVSGPLRYALTYRSPDRPLPASGWEWTGSFPPGCRNWADLRFPPWWSRK